MILFPRLLMSLKSFNFLSAHVNKHVNKHQTLIG